QTAKLEGMYGRVLKDRVLKDLGQEARVKPHSVGATPEGTSLSSASRRKQLQTAPRRRFAFVQTFCTHYTVGLFTLLAQRLDAQYFFHSDGGEWYRSEEHTSELQSRENLVCRL